MSRAMPVLQLLLLFEAVILAVNVAAWARNRRAMRSRPVARPLGDVPPLPAKLEPLVAALSELGFRPLGAVSVSGAGFRQPQTAWLYTAPRRGIHAELTVARGRPIAVLVTWFGDAALQTGTGRRLRMAQPGFVVQSAPDVPAAYHAHTAALADFRERAGEPVPIESMDAYLGYAAAYNEGFYGRMLAHVQPGLLASVLVTLYGVAVLTAALLIGASGRLGDYPLLLFAVGLLIPAMLAEIAIAAWKRRTGRQA